MPVDTSKIDRRKVRYNTPADLHADVARLVAADQAGSLTACGNWTLGQALGHLAAWVSFAFDGYPIKPPFIIKLLLRPKKRRYLEEGLPGGVHIPRVKGGTVATDVLPTAEGVSRFSQQWGRLEKTRPPLKSPIFGELTHSEWVQLNLRHAELHLSCFKAEAR